MTNVAQIASMYVKLDGDGGSFERTMNQAQKSVKKTSTVLKGFGSGAKQAGNSLTTFVSAPLLALKGMAVKQAAEFETLQVSMNSLNGSAEEGGKQFERLKEFSAGTPFQLPGLANTQNMLQGFGMEADDAFDSLNMIGDIAAITGGDLQGIGIAFGQASAEGRVMTQDIRQLINQGVPAIKMLAETMGVAEGDILNLASEGKISFDILQQSFRDATSEGGQFAGGMKQQSKTISGMFSTLKDNVNIQLAAIGQAVVDGLSLREVIPELIENVKTATKWFTGLSDESRKKIILLTTAIMGIGPVLVGVGATVTALGATFAALTSPITLIVGLITGISTAVLYLWDNWEAVTERISNISWWRNAIIDMVQFLLDYSPVTLLIDQFNNLLSYLGQETIPNPLSALSEELEGLKDDTVEYETEFGSLMDAFKNGGSAVLEYLGFLDETTDKTDEATESTNELSKALETLGSPKKVETPYSSDPTDQSRTDLSSFGRVDTGGLENAKKVAMDFSDALEGQITSSIVSFGETLAGVFTGDVGADGFFNGILSIVGSFAQQFGKIVVAMGVAALQIKSNLLTNPVAAIAAGSALVVLGGALSSLASSGPSGGGGLSGGSGGQQMDFEQQARSVPVANGTGNSQSGGSVTFEIEYDKLKGVLNNGDRKRSRI